MSAHGEKCWCNNLLTIRYPLEEYQSWETEGAHLHSVNKAVVNKVKIRYLMGEKINCIDWVENQPQNFETLPTFDSLDLSASVETISKHSQGIFCRVETCKWKQPDG